jgi:hypothetical protein
MARPFARSATTTAYFQPQLTAGPGGRLAFALPVRIGQASAMPSMKQGNPPDSGFWRHNRTFCVVRRPLIIK